VSSSKPKLSAVNACNHGLRKESQDETRDKGVEGETMRTDKADDQSEVADWLNQARNHPFLNAPSLQSKSQAPPHEGDRQ
jgi:hypothetical protein